MLAMKGRYKNGTFTVENPKELPLEEKAVVITFLEDTAPFGNPPSGADPFGFLKALEINQNNKVRVSEALLEERNEYR